MAASNLSSSKPRSPFELHPNGGKGDPGRPSPRGTGDKAVKQPQGQSYQGKQGGGRGTFPGPRGSRRSTNRSISHDEGKVEEFSTSPSSDFSESYGGGGDLLPSKGSKKGTQNLNHLLNFRYQRSHSNPNSSSYSSSSHLSPQKNRHFRRSETNAFDKEKFVQANYQFFVRENSSPDPFNVYLVDADKMLPWEAIEQVSYITHESMHCPICLDTPVAPKMTRCGHIFCWPCILHHLAMSPKAWNYCPLCEDYVYAKDLKSAVIKSLSLFPSGQRISMRLLRRHKSSVVAIPAAAYANLEASDHPLLTPGLEPQFLKLVLLKLDDVSQIIDREKGELSSPNVDPEDPFVHQALSMLEERRVLLLTTPPPLMSPLPNSHIPGFYPEALLKPQSEVEVKKKQHKTHHPDSASNKEDSAETVILVPSSEPIPITQASSLNVEAHVGSLEGSPDVDAHSHGSVGSSTPPPSSLSLDTSSPSSCHPNHVERGGTDDELAERDDTLYFFQSNDGQNVFLHPLNVRCLTAEFGSFGRCPAMLNGRVVEIERTTLTHAYRKKFRFLHHLPIGAEVAICEMDLSKYLSPRTRSLFENEFRARKKQRQKRMKEEELANKDESMVQAFSMSLADESVFPSYLSTPVHYVHIDDDYAPLVRKDTPSSSLPHSPTPNLLQKEDNAPPKASGTSFSQALLKKGDDAALWPQLGPSRPAQPAPRTTWVSTRDMTTSVSRLPKKADESDSEDPELGVYRAPKQDAVFSVADSDVNRALNALKLEKEKNEREKGEKGEAGGKGKKKGKKILLFATGNRH